MKVIHDKSHNFRDTEEFIGCFNCGCEFCFDYDGKSYAISPVGGSPGGFDYCGFGICLAYDEANETCYDTAEALLDHPIGDKRLRHPAGHAGHGQDRVLMCKSVKSVEGEMKNNFHWQLTAGNWQLF